MERPRRAFLRMGALALAAVALDARSQRVAKPRIGYLAPGDNPREAAFWQGMHDLGYVEGRSVEVERRSAGGDFSRLPALAAEIVKARPDVIVAITTSAALAARQATPSIPIVVVGANDPVGTGLVSSLSHPGGNVTGTSSQSSASVRKLLEVLRLILPRATRVAALWDPVNAISQQLRMGETLLAAARLNVLVRVVEIGSRDELAQAFAAAAAARLDAVLAPGDTFFMAHARSVAELGRAHRLPVLCSHRVQAEAGALASYGADVRAVARRAAHYVHRILKGAKPGDLAVELPTKFELVLNAATAAAIGVALGPAVLAQADDVIR